MSNMILTLDDIGDLRAYERERTGFRARIIALKKRRRVQVGPIVTLLFENRDTIRFQIQEMARAERLVSDEAIGNELAVYNPLISGPGRLSATLFIELTAEDHMHEWLPKLVGIERAVELRLGGDDPAVVVAHPEGAHQAQLTREAVTASVHYVHFDLSSRETEMMATGPVSLAVAHPEYAEEAVLSEDTRSELLHDLGAP